MGTHVETFTEPKKLIDNPRYPEQRRETLSALSDDRVDRPIAGLIRAFNRLPYCFTLQACWGHFVHAAQPDPQNLAPLSLSGPFKDVAYRIAYIALCLDDSANGRTLLSRLARIPSIAPDYIQFGSAEWFWERQLNSYALQVEPDRFKAKDKVSLNYHEALHVQAVRDEFFTCLKATVSNLSG